MNSFVVVGGNEDPDRLHEFFGSLFGGRVVEAAVQGKGGGTNIPKW